MVRETGRGKTGMSQGSSPGKCSVCGMDTKNNVCSGCGQPETKCNCK